MNNISTNWACFIFCFKCSHVTFDKINCSHKFETHPHTCSNYSYYNRIIINHDVDSTQTQWCIISSWHIYFFLWWFIQFWVLALKEIICVSVMDFLWSVSAEVMLLCNCFTRMGPPQFYLHIFVMYTCTPSMGTGKRV